MYAHAKNIGTHIENIYIYIYIYRERERETYAYAKKTHI